MKYHREPLQNIFLLQSKPLLCKVSLKYQTIALKSFQEILCHFKRAFSHTLPEVEIL